MQADDEDPSTEHVNACVAWLDAEINALRPRAVLTLGATAAKAVFGRAFRLTANRGVALPSRYSMPTYATIHPSAVLRRDDREDTYRSLVEDIRTVMTERPAGK